MDKFRYDPFMEPAKTEKEAEWHLYYFQQLVRSLEAKLERIDPLTDEFEGSMDTLFNAKQALEKAGLIYRVLHYQEVTKEYSK